LGSKQSGMDVAVCCFSKLSLIQLRLYVFFSAAYLTGLAVTVRISHDMIDL
jgi:hypothetical protein